MAPCETGRMKVIAAGVTANKKPDKPRVGDA
jgi:hypothetical protein